MRKKVSNRDPSDGRVMNLVTHHAYLSNCLVGLSIIIGSQILQMTDSWNAKGLARIEYA